MKVSDMGIHTMSFFAKLSYAVIQDVIDEMWEHGNKVYPKSRTNYFVYGLSRARVPDNDHFAARAVCSPCIPVT